MYFSALHTFTASLLFKIPARCVCNNTAKMLIPPLGSLVSLNPFGTEKKVGNCLYLMLSINSLFILVEVF